MGEVGRAVMLASQVNVNGDLYYDEDYDIELQGCEMGTPATMLNNMNLSAGTSLVYINSAGYNDPYNPNDSSSSQATTYVMTSLNVTTVIP